MARPALMLLAALLGVTATVTPALAQYRFGMSAAIAAVLVTITLGILLRAAIVLVYTDRIRHPLPLLGLANPPRRLPGGAVVSTFDLLTVAVAATLFVGLFAFLRLSPLGIQMRAAGEKPLLAAQRGINFQLLFALSWALAGGLDSLGGVIPGALIVAAVEVLSVRYGDPLLADVSPFLCLLAMLLVRPWGLFGTREELERV